MQAHDGAVWCRGAAPYTAQCTAVMYSRHVCSPPLARTLFSAMPFCRLASGLLLPSPPPLRAGAAATTQVKGAAPAPRKARICLGGSEPGCGFTRGWGERRRDEWDHRVWDYLTGGGQCMVSHC